jgi:EmrB/QacA subfamily drug resistance transporter
MMAHISTRPVAGAVRYGTSTGRWVILATVLGSGIAFLDGTVVNVALPTIADDLGAGLSGLQWTLDAYLLTLSSLLLLGGSLGDIYGRRRVYVSGLVGFTGASLLCGVAPTMGTLIAARALQGVGGALLVPGSLAIIAASFRPEDRSRAVGAWSGLAGVSGALGPFVGGWLIDAVSWRLVFLVNLPLAAAAVLVTLRHVPESRDTGARHRPDVPGAVAVSVGLAGVAYALIEGPGGMGATEVGTAFLGVVALVVFLVLEARRPDPMLPLEIFRSRQFSGANATTLAVYSGLGGATFLLVLQLRLVLGYSALEAGASLLPITLLLLVLSPRAGQLAQRIGPRWPMTAGPVIVAVGLLLFTRVDAGRSYVTAVLPAVLVFGAGLALTVAPLTSAVLAAVEERHVGVGSGVNNAVARIAGMLAVAVLPGLAGLDSLATSGGISDAFTRAMVFSAAVCAAGGVVAFFTVRTAAPVPAVTQPSIDQACHHPSVREREDRPAA